MATIDEFYSTVEKSNYYLGLVSSVLRDQIVLQVENLSLLSQRIVRNESLIPNTINYLVVFDTKRGLFIGEVFQSKINVTNSVHEALADGMKEDVYPEISVKVLGKMSDARKFVMHGFETVGITDKVYIANGEIRKTFLQSIQISSNTEQLKLENLATLTGFGEDEQLSLQPNTLFDRHLMTIGTTNSGKSTSALAILDKLLANGNKVLIIDPTGEYQDSFSETEITKLTLGEDATIPVGQIKLSQWERVFETNENTQGATLSRAIKSLRYMRKVRQSTVLRKNGMNILDVEHMLADLSDRDTEFNLELLPAQIEAEGVQVNRNGTAYESTSFSANINNWLFEKVQVVLENSTFLDFFKTEPQTNLLTRINSFVNESGSLYINASGIGSTDGVGAMIVDLIASHIMSISVGRPFVLFIDEAHRYTKDVDNDFGGRGLASIAREGRKKGIFLFLTTQNPKDVPESVLSQVGTLLIHRLTQAEEIQAIQSHVQPNLLAQITKLNQGEAILSSINLLQNLHVRFNKSERMHGNDTPLL